MGCSISAIHDDEDEWNSFCEKYKLDVNWDVYSVKAALANDAVRINNASSGAEIKLWVKHELAMRKIKADYEKLLKEEKAEFKTALKYLKGL